MSWPLYDPADLDRLVQKLPFNPTSDEARELDRALAAWRRAARRPPLPWPSWALRLPAMLGAAMPAERFAAAIALLTSPETGPAATALAVALLAELGARREAIATVLLEAQLHPPPMPVPEVPGTAELSDDTLGRDLILLFGLGALCAGAEPGPWLRFAEALLDPLALFVAVFDLVDDTPCEELPPPRLGGLLGVCRGDGDALAALLDGCAGGFRYVDRLLQLRAAIGSEALLRQLRAHREASLAAARAALPATGGAAFLDALGDSFAALDSPLWTHALLARALGGAPDIPAQAAIGLQAALDYLAETRPWRSAWDVHRFHPFGAADVLVGRGFIEGLILLALADCGHDPQAEIAALLAQVPDGDARYFPGFADLPPDADSLGLLLQLAARLAPMPRPKVASWLAVLDASLDETGVVPVWFERGPQGRTTPLDGPFLGNDCTAVRLAFLLGALAYDGERFADRLAVNLRATLPRYDGRGFTGCVHYASSFAVHLFVRLAQKLCGSERPALRRIATELGLASALATCSRDLAARQRIDGGWGSPQETALALEALAALPDIAPDRLRRALKYLGDTQNPDGAWAAEPLYITPGKYGGMVPLATKEVTTALCARALHAGCVRLRQGAEERVS